MIAKPDMDFITGQMEESLKDGGTKGNSMGLVYIKILSKEN